MDEETRKKIKEMRTKYENNKEIQFLLSELTNLELKLIDADIMALRIDLAIQEGRLNARSLIGDARRDYGTPGEYEFAKEDFLRRYRNGIDEVIEDLSKKEI